MTHKESEENRKEVDHLVRRLVRLNNIKGDLRSLSTNASKLDRIDILGASEKLNDTRSHLEYNIICLEKDYLKYVRDLQTQHKEVADEAWLKKQHYWYNGEGK